jgi:hypothetical protein
MLAPSSGVVRFFGVIIDCPLVIDGKQIASEALRLVAVLMKKLHASVALQDLQRREAHVKMTVEWLCLKTAPDEVPAGMRDPDGEQLSAPINWRWRLWAAPETHFAADAFDAVLVNSEGPRRVFARGEVAGCSGAP